VVAGPGSLGALLEGRGYRAVPSPRQPGPGEERYYRGGHITQTHGSSHAGAVDAIQVELPAPAMVQVEVPAEIRHEGGEPVRTAFARALAGALAQFIATHYPA
jgi:N-formylglutamate amidohydrolase